MSITRSAGSAGAEVAAAAYRAMSILKNAVPPAALGVVLTGVVLSLGTNWGLFTHLWVVVELVLTVSALPMSILLVFPSVQRAAAAPTAEPPPLGLMVSTTLVALGGAAVIAVYKPWGLVSCARTAGLSTRPALRR